MTADPGARHNLAAQLAVGHGGRFAALEGARAIAAIGVVVYHAATETFLQRTNLPVGWLVGNLGNFGVAVFFCLSSFLLFLPFSRAWIDGAPQPATGPFLLRRMARIYPAYWIVLIVYGLTEGLRTTSLSQLVRVVTLTQGYSAQDFGVNFGVGLGVAWTLAIEVTLYLGLPVFAAIIRAVGRRSTTPRHRLIVQLICIGVLAGIAIEHRLILAIPQSGEFKVRNLWPLNYLDWFALGMLLATAVAWRDAAPASGASRSLPNWLVWLHTRTWVCWGGSMGAYVLLAATQSGRLLLQPEHLAQMVTRHGLNGLASVLLVLPIALGDGRDKHVQPLSRPWPTYFGVISFGIYLWHTVVLAWLRDSPASGTDQQRFFILLTLTLLISIALATASYHLVEKPIMDRVRQGRVRRTEVNGERWLPLKFTALLSRLFRTAHDRLWPTTLLFGVISLLIMLRNSPLEYIGDNRFEQSFAPGRRLLRSLTIWDSGRGLGAPREDFWPGSTIPLAIGRSFGLPVAVVEHLWHASCLTMVAVGVVAVAQLYLPRIGAAHLIAGALAAFGPFSASFLLPSNLYLQFAVGPWLVVALHRGTRSARPWRWAALFALLIFWAGNTDLPGLLYNALVLVPMATYLVLVERSVTLRRLIGWTMRAVALAVACSAAALVKTYSSADQLAQRLGESELASSIAVASSWSESLRGVGNWLSYFAVYGELDKPQTAALFTNPLVYALTFVPVIAGLAFLARSRWQPRLLFGAMIIMSLSVMVGGFHPNQPSILGRWILGAFEAGRPLAAFRNTYKAAGGLVIGGSILAATAVVTAGRTLRQRNRVLGSVPYLASIGVLIGVSLPFWSGSLYHPDERLKSVPSYWTEAFSYLDNLDQPGRSFIVPPTTLTRYRWGWLGDDMVDAMMNRPHAVPEGIPSSTETSASMLESLALITQDPIHRPGVIGPIAERLGFTEFVIRNDLDWQSMGITRPAALRGLRSDPSFERVATFGRPGLNVVDPKDDSPEALYEQTLPPVEVYRLRRPAALVQVVPGRPIVVAGDGTAITALARHGLLDRNAPLLLSAETEPTRLAEQIARGASVVSTDTNRRRLRTLLANERDYSGTLAEGQDLDRVVSTRFDRRGAESVAWFPEALKVDGLTSRFGGSRPSDRPAMAFDLDPATAWRVQRFEASRGTVLRVEFREPVTLHSATIDSYTVDGLPSIRAGRLKLADGSEFAVRFAPGLPRSTIDLTGHTATSLSFIVDEYEPTASYVGINDIRLVDASLRTVDLREFIELPDDIRQLSITDPALAEAVTGQPTTYLFDRVVRATFRTQVVDGGTDESSDEERTIRRRFFVPRAQAMQLSGTLRIRKATPISTVALITGRQTNEVLTPTDRLAELDNDCIDLGIVVGLREAPIRVPVRVSGFIGDVVDGRDLTVTSCQPILLDAGWNLFDESLVRGFDGVMLAPAGDADDLHPIARGRATDITEGPGDVVATFDLAGPATVVLANSFDPRWSLSVDGTSVGPAASGIGLNQWAITGDGPSRLHFTYDVEPTMRWAWMITLGSVGLCLLLILRRPSGATAAWRPTKPSARHTANADDLWAPMRSWARRSAGGERDGPTGRHVAGALCLITFAAAIGWVIIGPAAILIVPLALGAMSIARRPVRTLASGGVALIALAPIASLAQRWPRSGDLNTGYALQRSSANDLVATGVAVLVVAIILGWFIERSAIRVTGESPTVSFTDVSVDDVSDVDGAAKRETVGKSLPGRRLIWVRRVLDGHRLIVPAAATAIVIRDLASSPVWSPGYKGLIAQLRLGRGYETGLPDVRAASLPPIPALLGVVMPVGERVLAALICIAVAALATHIGARLLRPVIAPWVAVGLVLMPMIWGGTLPAQVALLALLAGWAVATGDQISRRHAVVAGVLAAAAVLSRPEAIVIVIAFVWWYRRTVRRSFVALFLSGFLASIAPWIIFVHHTIGSWSLIAGRRALLSDPSDITRAWATATWLGLVAGLTAALALSRSTGFARATRALVSGSRWVRDRLLPASLAPTVVIAPASRQFRRQLALVTVLGTAWRLSYLFAAKGAQPLVGDSIFFSMQAQNLASGDKFTLFGRAAANHPPFTAIAVAPMEWIFPGSIFAQRFPPLIAGTAVIVVIGLLGRRVASERVGIATACVAAGYANFWMNDAIIMPESFATLFVCGLILAAYRYAGSGRWRVAVAMGGLVGLAALSRAELILLGVVVVAPVVLWQSRTTDYSMPWKRRLIHLGLAGLATTSVIAPWIAHNLQRFDERVTLSTGQGLLQVGANCDSSFYGSGIGFWSRSCAGDVPVPDGVDESERSRRYQQASADYLSSHRYRLPVVVTARLGRLWNFYNPEQTARLDEGSSRERWASLLGTYQYSVLIPLAIAGLVVLRRRRVSLVPLLGPVIMITGLAAWAYGPTRLRLPVDIALVLLAGASVDLVHRRSNAGKRGRLPVTFERVGMQRFVGGAIGLWVTIAAVSFVVDAHLGTPPAGRGLELVARSSAVEIDPSEVGAAGWSDTHGAFLFGDDTVTQRGTAMRRSMVTRALDNVETDVFVTMEAVPTGAGLLFSGIDERNHWSVVAVPEVSTWNVVETRDGIDTVVANLGLASTEPGVSVALRIRPDHVDVLINGALLKTVEDIDLTRGRMLGLVADGANSKRAKWTELRVYRARFAVASRADTSTST